MPLSRIACLAAVLLIACRDHASAPANAPFGEPARPSPIPPSAASNTSAQQRPSLRATQIAAGGGTLPDCLWATTNAPPACDGHTCARMSDGTLRCWGYNGAGQLGDGTQTARATPAPVPGLSGVASVAAGGAHTCAVMSDATVRCWGANRYGQLGDGTTQDRSTPVVVRALTNVASLALGAEHSCARLRDGSVRCWGRNPAGQLCDGTRADHFTPAAASGLAHITQMSLGVQHGCAVSEDGSAWCWGRNDHRQLADGTEQNHATAFAVPGLPGPASQISAGDAHSCALLRDGHVWCWGWNNSGQLGDGNTVMRAVPAPVPNLTDVAEIALAPSRTCARRNDGTVWCVSRTTQPTRIEGVTDAVSLVLAGGHACALRNDGTLRCWGRNRAGELGTGTMSERSDTVAIVW